jgi:hypothetical protein
MRRLISGIVLFLALCAAASPLALYSGGPAYDAHPGPPSESEFYWDDGILAGGWVWFTGGSYWAVKFDEVKTGGGRGDVVDYGAVAYPGWPDSTFQGCYMHTFDDLGGYPGADLDSTYLGFTTGGLFEWVDTFVYLTDGVFYIAFEQYGNYPACDAVGVDAVAGTHDWTGYQGSWSPTTAYGDFLLRCYWDSGGYDIIPPGVCSQNPDDGEVGVHVDTTIVFHVWDDLSGVDVATIELTVEDASRNPKRVNLAFSTDGPSPTGVISGELEINDADIRNVVCTFTPDTDLPYGETITCTVPGTLADREGNEMGQDEVWSFETQGARVSATTWGRVKALY